MTTAYLVDDLVRAGTGAPQSITAWVFKLNPAPAPYQQRVLVELQGHFVEAYEPMNGPDSQPVDGSRQLTETALATATLGAWLVVNGWSPSSTRWIR